MKTNCNNHTLGLHGESQIMVRTSFYTVCKKGYYTQQEFIRKATQSLSYNVFSLQTVLDETFYSQHSFKNAASGRNPAFARYQNLMIVNFINIFCQVNGESIF